MLFSRMCLVFLFSLVPCFSALAQRLNTLSAAPDWSRLEAFQETMTRGEFVRLLETVYAPGRAAAGVIEVREDDVVIFKKLSPPERMTLRFAKDVASARPAPRFWRPASKMGPASADKPLAGLRIALDPGHIGWVWARMEERSFRRAEDGPVQVGT